ncbi:hypothetical protein BU17DRAFT_95034 [Hysterangium stoloniferum]|nr:hypothetical protein BU17DRAFT_95034 [Hysterangium stoloniferum]
MGRLLHISIAFHPAAHPATLKSRRNAAARLAAVGPSATAPPSSPATVAHACADFSRFMETLPVKERGGRCWIIAISNGVFMHAIDRGGNRNDKGGGHLFPALDHPLLLLSLLDPTAPFMVFCVSTYSGVATDEVDNVTSELFGGGIRARLYGPHLRA